ncbi:MAG: 16S rRNA (cytidine(1402)-2'-O)-methyltransferase [Myxococcota bacterium]
MKEGTLYLVATPLGNLEDISQRVARCLAEADIVYAEDTRRSRILVEHLGLPRELRSLHEHNEHERSAEVVAHLRAGKTVALVSDAGTPAVSDPGATLVRLTVEAGFTVSPVPGPSALTAALSVSGFSAVSTDVAFFGFLPVKGKLRRLALERVGTSAGVVVLFEAPHRIEATLRDLCQLEPARPACVCRELTKVHEEIRYGSVEELLAWAAKTVRGELTLVLGPSAVETPTPDDAEVDAALKRCLAAGLSARDAAAAVAAVLQRSKREVYARCQKLSTGIVHEY